MNKKILILVLAAAILVIAVFALPGGSPSVNLDDLAAKNPNLVEFVDRVKEVENREPEKDKEIEYYLELGLAWKSLADRTRDKDHYQKALEAYEKGIKASGRKNTVLLNNAGNMAVYLEDYKKAAEYYEESISISPGDAESYIRLANLHQEYLKSSPEAIIGIYDRGIARMLNPDILEQRKRMYLESIGVEE